LFRKQPHDLVERFGGRGALFCQRGTRLGVGVEHHAAVPRFHQATGNVAAHATKSDHADLHLLHSSQRRRYASAASTARVKSASPASTSFKWTRSARRPRSTNTSRSPRACAAFTTPKL